MRRRDLFLAPLPFLWPGLDRAHAYRQGPIEIGHPWARPSVTGAAAVFLALSNTGKASDRLVGGATPIAEQVILRREDGTALDYLELLPHRPLLLRPGGKYLGLPGLTRLLALDDTFPLTLRFANAGEIEVSVTVEDGPAE
jgi:copper(I)-binding protein